MPPARATSAAAEETIRRARGGAASQRGRNRSDVPAPGGHGASASEGNVDWDAIFRTIDGQQGGQPGPSHRPNLPPLQPTYDYPYPPGLDPGLGSSSMSAGPSSSSAHPPWAADTFQFGLGGQVSHIEPDPHSRGPSPHRPHPSRSQSFPFYHDPFHQSSPVDRPEGALPHDEQNRQRLHDYMPPPPGIGPFGMGGMTSEPNSFGSGSSASIASLLNHPGSAQFQHFFPPLASPTHPTDHLGRTLSNMDPPPTVGHRGQQSISHQPFDFSGQSSVNPSPAPTPLSNPTSGEDSEDKRVRNTVASAKFRAKKKEQIANVQRTISELEVQQAGLEADVASLRNENGLLREMVQIKYGTKIPEN